MMMMRMITHLFLIESILCDRCTDFKVREESCFGNDIIKGGITVTKGLAECEQLCRTYDQCLAIKFREK